MNLTLTIEELILAQIDKDQERLNQIKQEFEEVLNNQSLDLKRKIMSYVINHKSVIENEKLFIYFQNFVV